MYARMSCFPALIESFAVSSDTLINCSLTKQTKTLSITFNYYFHQCGFKNAYENMDSIKNMIGNLILLNLVIFVFVFGIWSTDSHYIMYNRTSNRISITWIIISINFLLMIVVLTAATTDFIKVHSQTHPTSCMYISILGSVSLITSSFNIN